MGRMTRRKGPIGPGRSVPRGTNIRAMLSRWLLVPISLVLLGACSGVPAPPPLETPAAPSPLAAERPVVEVHRSPTCDCCKGWEEYLKARGYSVRSVISDDVTSLKIELGLPRETWSCHTALVDGYVVEGHVPIEAIEDVLRDRPAIDGIALPGMPPGSPGMGGEKVAPFEILAIEDGEISPYGVY